VSANALPDSRSKKVNAAIGLCWPRLCPKVSKGARRRRPKERHPEPARQSHGKVIDWAKQDSEKDHNRQGSEPDNPSLLRGFNAK
jgi:hypothetical protein